MDAIYDLMDKIAEAAFSELAAAETETEKNEIRAKIRDGEFIRRMNALRGQVPADSLTAFDDTMDFFRRCGDDDSLIEVWRLLA